MKIALAGNPNSGKTTLFNLLTGANQTVGNWPGVTVEHKEGRLKKHHEVIITDLPGIYSLSPYTQEEVVSRNYLLDDDPDAIIDIVDGSNLERNLYLTTQLLELGIPVIVAVNMMDVVRKNGDTIDTEALAQELGTQVVEISALKNEGIDELIKLATSDALAVPRGQTDFSSEIEKLLDALTERYLETVPGNQRRWYAIKLFERDAKVQEKLGLDASAVGAIDRKVTELEDELDDDAESLITASRYDRIEGIVRRCAVRRNEGKMTTSDKIDRVVTSRILGLPIFILVMVAIYYLSISTVGTAATDWANDNLFGDGWYIGDFSGEAFDAWQSDMGDFEDAQGEADAFVQAAQAQGLDPDSDSFLSDAEKAGITATYDVYDEDTGENEAVTVTPAVYREAQQLLDQYGEEGPDPYEYGAYVPGIPTAIGNALSALNLSDWLYGLIVDGVVTGICAMLGFLPQMFVLFVLLALLEGCGYMSRVAFVLDRIFRRFGLSGKSFIPILIGTGCGVPGIMASRTIEDENDRRMTIMTTTFIPCSAKIPVIALIASAVFGGVWWVAPSAYFLGLATILCTGILMKKTRFFAGDAAPFVMELPAYHVPTLGFVGRSVWDRLWAFIKKAFTILLIATTLIWLLSNFGFENGAFGMVEDMGNSLLAVIGGALAWIFAPLGWADWRAVGATVSGFMAKEDIVGTIGILYGTATMPWYQAFQQSFLVAAGYSFLAFNLLCMPCFAAVSTIASEMHSAKWTLAAIGYQFLAAWLVAFWIFQFGGLVTGESAFGIGTVCALGTFAGFVYLLVRPNPYKRKLDSVTHEKLAEPEAA
ncbi:MAG: ferrous iron transporter B [Eggerthellaceae bacterium]|jgi:ferrous iron transport protein B